MIVKELIEILKKADPNQEVTVWDPYHDTDTFEVHVSALDGYLHISNSVFGEEIK